MPENPEGRESNLAGFKGDVSDGLLLCDLFGYLNLKAVKLELDDPFTLGSYLVEIV